MNDSYKKSKFTAARIALFCLLIAAITMGMAQWSTIDVSANHPVLVEGNCDSPVPGTTIVTAGTCGDFDGDGRIGTAEDTDGADRIFGTLKAALGPGSGAAAGTGANFNGKIIIVTSGRFAETLFIGDSGLVPGEGSANPGNVTIEAAPGVNADIDAVLQGDPAGGNTARQGATGITIAYSATGQVVTLRNLQIRNWTAGVGIFLNSRVHIDGCRLENNRDHGVRISDNSRTVVSRSQIDATGRRIPVSGPSVPGNGITVDGNAQARIAFTNISHSSGAGIFSISSSPVSLFNVTTYFNNPDVQGNAVIATNPNFAQ